MQVDIAHFQNGPGWGGGPFAETEFGLLISTSMALSTVAFDEACLWLVSLYAVKGAKMQKPQVRE